MGMHAKMEKSNQNISDEAIGILIVAKLKGDISPQDNRILSRWLEASPRHREVFSEYALLDRSLTTGQMKEDDVEEALREVKTVARNTPPVRHFKVFKYLVPAAAAVLLAVILLYGAYTHGKESAQSPTRYLVENPDPSPLRTVLPDGSTVWLRSGSSICYAQEFMGEKRLVKLCGEAYFDIAPMPDKPFVVESSSFHVQVLGTVFNFKEGPDGDGEVTLAKGSVLLQDAGGRGLIRLKPGQKASWNRPGESLDISEVPVGDLLRAYYGAISLKNATISEIISELEKNLSARFVPVSGSDNGKRYDFSFQENCSPESAVDMLNFICNDMKFAIDK